MANENELELQLAQAQAEIDRLRSENEALSQTEHRAAGHHWIRSTAVVVLFVLGFALVPVAGLAVWSRNTLLDTDRYVETVAPLSDDPQVIDSVAGRVTDAIFAQIDVEGELAANLPPKLTFAAGPIANQVESTTNDLVVKALETDQFDTLWREVNRQASEAMVAYVENEPVRGRGHLRRTAASSRSVPILDAVKSRLLEQGVSIASKIPSTDASVPLPVGDVSYLQDLKSGMRLLKTLAFVLPWIAALCFLGAVLLSRDRRRGIVWTGLLVAGAALLVGVSLALGRQAYLDAAVAGGADLGTAQAVFDTVVRFLRNGIRVIFFFGTPARLRRCRLRAVSVGDEDSRAHRLAVHPGWREDRLAHRRLRRVRRSAPQGSAARGGRSLRRPGVPGRPANAGHPAVARDRAAGRPRRCPVLRSDRAPHGRRRTRTGAHRVLTGLTPCPCGGSRA